jgi:hypothetical protein
VSAAILLHAALGGWYLAQMQSAPRGTQTVFSISLAPVGFEEQSSAPIHGSELPASIAPAVALVDKLAGAPLSELTPGQFDSAPERVHSLRPVDAELAIRASRNTATTAQTEYFYRSVELTHLPGLPGDPVIDLGDLSDEVTGNVALRLFINETGQVVNLEIEGGQGLPDGVTDLLTRAFSTYSYVPGQRDGQAVKCQVVLLIGVREGQAFTGATSEPEQTEVRGKEDPDTGH